MNAFTFMGCAKLRERAAAAMDATHNVKTLNDGSRIDGTWWTLAEWLDGVRVVPMQTVLRCVTQLEEVAQ